MKLSVSGWLYLGLAVATFVLVCATPMIWLDAIGIFFILLILQAVWNVFKALVRAAVKEPHGR